MLFQKKVNVHNIKTKTKNKMSSYFKFTKKLLCQKNIQKYKKYKDLRYRKYFEILEMYKKYSKLLNLYDYTPNRMNLKKLDNESIKILNESKYKFAKVLFEQFRNYPQIKKKLKMNTNDNIGISKIDKINGKKIYKMLIYQMTEIKNPERIEKFGHHEHKKIINELNHLKNIENIFNKYQFKKQLDLNKIKNILI